MYAVLVHTNCHVLLLATRTKAGSEFDLQLPLKCHPVLWEQLFLLLPNNIQVASVFSSQKREVIGI